MNLWNPITRRQVHKSIAELGPWYQNISLGAGIFTRPINRETIGQWYNCERGFRKMDRFIKPMLPFPLYGRSVLEIGTNASQNLLWCWKNGARACVGVESDPRYLDQSWFIRETMTKILKRDIPITTYSGKAEDLRPIRYYGRRYDIGMILSVIYHIPEQYRVDVLENAIRLCKCVILQGNGLEDTGNGRGYDSLMKIIDAADATVYSIKREKHVRGLVIMVGK